MRITVGKYVGNWIKGLRMVKGCYRFRPQGFAAAGELNGSGWDEIVPYPGLCYAQIRGIWQMLGIFIF